MPGSVKESEDDSRARVNNNIGSQRQSNWSLNMDYLLFFLC